MTQILYRPGGSTNAVPIDAVFRQPFVLAQGTGETGVEAYGPSVFVRRDVLPSDPDVDDPILTIVDDKGATADYRVTERRSAGLGSLVLELRKIVL